MASERATPDRDPAQSHLRRVDPVMARLVDADPDFDPRAWWTVQGFLIIALDRQDVVLPGDLALRKSIRRLYGLDHLPSQQEVVALAEQWRPYRSLATSYLFQAAYEATAWAQG